MTTPRAYLAALALLTAMAAPAAAQERLEGLIGLGAGVAPEYEGANEYRPIPLVPLSLRYRGFGVETAGQGLQVDVTPWRFINFGPVVQYRGGRKNVDDPVVDNLPDIDGTVEAGGYLEMNLPFIAPGLDAWTLSANATHGVTGGHDGWLVTPAVRYSIPFGDRWRVNAIASSAYASEDYNETFFSVTPAGAAASGLPVYSADGGWKDVSGTLTASYRFAENWGVLVVGRYSRLIGDASNSPIVDQRGSENQFLGGLAVYYTF